MLNQSVRNWRDIRICALLLLLWMMIGCRPRRRLLLLWSPRVSQSVGNWLDIRNCALLWLLCIMISRPRRLLLLWCLPGILVHLSSRNVRIVSDWWKHGYCRGAVVVCYHRLGSGGCSIHRCHAACCRFLKSKFGVASTNVVFIQGVSKGYRRLFDAEISGVERYAKYN